MKRRLLLLTIITSLILLLTSLPVAAQGVDGVNHDLITGARYQTNDGRAVLQGGVNRLGNVVGDTNEEIYALESKLRANGYVLVTTDDKEITDEDYKLLKEGNFAPPFIEYFEPTEFSWDMKMMRVYLYKPSLDDALEQLRTNEWVDFVVQVELQTSAVLIDYGINFFEERVGKVLNEFNDNIPSWYEGAGYLEIRSSIDAEVILELWSEHSYSILYVTGGVPLLVKVKEGMHVVREINYTGIAVKETALPPSNNLVVREDENTIDNPKIMDLNGIIEKYEIEPMNISDKPDYSWGNKDNLKREDYLLPVESVVIDLSDVESPPDKAQASKLWIIIIALAVLGLLVFIFKKGGESDEQ